MKKIKKMPLVISITLMVLLLGSIGILSFNARETKNMNNNTINQNSKIEDDNSINEESSLNEDFTDISNISEEQLSEEQTSIVKEENQSSNNQSNTSSSTTIKKDDVSTQNVEVKSESSSTKVEEQNNTTSTTTDTSTSQNNSSNNDTNNISTDYYNYKTGGNWDYDTESVCYAKGNLVVDLELNDILDYNEAHMDAQISPDILNTECFPVNTNSGVKWFLQINCISGNCNEKYKTKYLK